MENSNAVPWFSANGGRFHGREPFYYDTNKFTWVKDVESQWETIKTELEDLCRNSSDSLLPYSNKEMTSAKDKWKTFGLMFWKFRSDENCTKCPKTWGILSKIPNITAASFNLLEANTTIKPHHGDTDAIIRCHMGIDVPGEAPRCAFRVGTETRSWKEGKFLMFCDAHEHTAWNNTDKPRYIMVVDIMRPEFVSKEKTIVARVLSSIRLEVLYQQQPWLRRYMGSSWQKRLVLSMCRATVRLMLIFKRTSLNATP